MPARKSAVVAVAVAHNLLFGRSKEDRPDSLTHVNEILSILQVHENQDTSSDYCLS